MPLFTVGGKSCLEPASLERQCRKLGIDTSWWAGRPNSIVIPRGREACTATLLMCYGEFVDFDPTVAMEVIVTGATEEETITFTHMYVEKSETIAFSPKIIGPEPPVVEDDDSVSDDNAEDDSEEDDSEEIKDNVPSRECAVLVTLRDIRIFGKMSYINRGYNVTVRRNTVMDPRPNSDTLVSLDLKVSPSGLTKGFYEDTLNYPKALDVSISSREFTWKEVLQDIWDKLPGDFGVFIERVTDEGSYPESNPRDLEFYGMSAWEAFNHVLDYTGNTIVLSGTTGDVPDTDPPTDPPLEDESETVGPRTLGENFTIVDLSVKDTNTAKALGSLQATEPVYRTGSPVTSIPESLKILFPLKDHTVWNEDLNRPDHEQIYPSDMDRNRPFHEETVDLGDTLKEKGLGTPRPGTELIIRDNLEAIVDTNDIYINDNIGPKTILNQADIEVRKTEIKEKYISLKEEKEYREGVFHGIPRMTCGSSLASTVVLDIGSGLNTIAYLDTIPSNVMVGNRLFVNPFGRLGNPGETQPYPIPPYPDPTNNREPTFDLIPIRVTETVLPFGKGKADRLFPFFHKDSGGNTIFTWKSSGLDIEVWDTEGACYPYTRNPDINYAGELTITLDAYDKSSGNVQYAYYNWILGKNVILPGSSGMVKVSCDDKFGYLEDQFVNHVGGDLEVAAKNKAADQVEGEHIPPKNLYNNGDSSGSEEDLAIIVETLNKGTPNENLVLYIDSSEIPITPASSEEGGDRAKKTFALVLENEKWRFMEVGPCE